MKKSNRARKIGDGYLIGNKYIIPKKVYNLDEEFSLDPGLFEAAIAYHTKMIKLDAKRNAKRNANNEGSKDTN